MCVCYMYLQFQCPWTETVSCLIFQRLQQRFPHPHNLIVIVDLGAKCRSTQIIVVEYRHLVNVKFKCIIILKIYIIVPLNGPNSIKTH